MNDLRSCSIRLMCVISLSSPLQSLELTLSCVSFFLASHIRIMLIKSILHMYVCHSATPCRTARRHGRRLSDRRAWCTGVGGDEDRVSVG